MILQHPYLFEVEALVAGSNAKLLAEQAVALKAKRVAIADASRFQELSERLSHTDIEVFAGEEAILDLCRLDVDWVMASIVGLDGLKPTYEAVGHAKIVAIANKECLVAAGDFLLEKARQSNTVILPVDSEHNALAQLYSPLERKHIEKIILTASGGPFRLLSKTELKQVTVEQALKHPNWSMGVKNTIDSATLMNKGLEVIEAHHLFGHNIEIDVLVHPESIVHGMIQYKDGSFLANLSSPDMRVPISHCLAWPERLEHALDRLSLAKLGQLNFNDPDEEKFPSLPLCRQAFIEGSHATTALNAANEIAVEAFIQGQIGFTEITQIVQELVETCPNTHLKDIEDVYMLDQQTRQRTKMLLRERV